MLLITKDREGSDLVYSALTGLWLVQGASSPMGRYPIFTHYAPAGCDSFYLSPSLPERESSIRRGQRPRIIASPARAKPCKGVIKILIIHK